MTEKTTRKLIEILTVASDSTAMQLREIGRLSYDLTGTEQLEVDKLQAEFVASHEAINALRIRLRNSIGLI